MSCHHSVNAFSAWRAETGWCWGFSIILGPSKPHHHLDATIKRNRRNSWWAGSLPLRASVRMYRKFGNKRSLLSLLENLGRKEHSIFEPGEHTFPTMSSEKLWISQCYLRHRRDLTISTTPITNTSIWEGHWTTSNHSSSEFTDTESSTKRSNHEESKASNLSKQNKNNKDNPRPSPEHWFNCRLESLERGSESFQEEHNIGSIKR